LQSQLGGPAGERLINDLQLNWQWCERAVHGAMV
jgi:hypothetical protein